MIVVNSTERHGPFSHVTVPASCFRRQQSTSSVRRSAPWLENKWHFHGAFFGLLFRMSWNVTSHPLAHMSADTHTHHIYDTVISRIKKHHDMYRGFREIFPGTFEVTCSRRIFDIHMEAARSLGAAETPKRQASSSPLLPFCFHRGKDWSLDVPYVPYVYWNGDLKGWKSSSIKFLFSFLDCNVWTHQAEAIATPYTMILPRAWMPRLAALWSRMWHLGWIEFSSVWYSPTTWQEDICVAWGRFLVDWVLVL